MQMIALCILKDFNICKIQSDKSAKQSENISDAATNHPLPISLNESVTATPMAQIDSADIPPTDIPLNIYNELFQSLKPTLPTQELGEGTSKQGELGIVGNDIVSQILLDGIQALSEKMDAPVAGLNDASIKLSIKNQCGLFLD